MSPGGGHHVWILAHLLGLITTFLHAGLGHLPQNKLASKECYCGQWETSTGPCSGPLLPVLHEHVWQHMD